MQISAKRSLRAVTAIIDCCSHSWTNRLRPCHRSRNLAAVTRLVVACIPASAFSLQVRFFRLHMNVLLLFRLPLVRHVLSLQHRGISQPAIRLPQENIRLPQSTSGIRVAVMCEVPRPAESVPEMDPKQPCTWSVHEEVVVTRTGKLPVVLTTATPRHACCISLQHHPLTRVSIRCV